jgi:8-oxo-dGTP pyrophosphatase MutT (NUDIX family)
VREVREETGLEVEFVRSLGEIEGAHYVHAKSTGQTSETWEHHRPEGDVVVCRWLPVSADTEVWGERGAYLHALVRKRVMGYVTRERGGRHELLIFEHRDLADVPTQVPAGRIDAHEDLEAGLRREVEEETGLTNFHVVGELADSEEVDRLYGVFKHESWAFHLVADADGPDTWEHFVTGTGMDSGLVYACRWVPLAECPPLWGKPDPLVAKLRRSIQET